MELQLVLTFQKFGSFSICISRLIQLKITAARTIVVLTLMIFICKDLIMNKQVKINDTIFQFKKMRNKLSRKKINVLNNRLPCVFTQIETHKV